MFGKINVAFQFTISVGYIIKNRINKEMLYERHV